MENRTENSNSIATSVVGLVVFLVTIATVTSLLNNKSISIVQTQATQVESRLHLLREEAVAEAKKEFDLALRSLQKEMVATANRQTAQVEQLALKVNHIETGLKADLQALAQTQAAQAESRLRMQFDLALRSLQKQMAAAIKSQNAQVEELAQKVEADMQALVQVQNAKIDGLTAQLQTLTEDGWDSQQNALLEQLDSKPVVQEKNDQLEQLSRQVQRLKLIIKADMAALETVLNAEIAAVSQQEKTLETQLQTLTTETAQLDQQQNVQIEQLTHQVNQFETRLKTEMLTVSQKVKADMATLKTDFNAEIAAISQEKKGFETQLQTMATETAHVDQQQNLQLEQLNHQVSQFEIIFKADMEARTQEQSKQLKQLNAQFQLVKDMASLNLRQNDQIEQLARKIAQIDTQGR